MAINRWRTVTYTDDGCYIFQCLSCYGEWEGRSNPSYCDWSYCPKCGTKWDGQQEGRQQGEPRYYRQRRFESLDEMRERENNEMIWVIEQQVTAEYVEDGSKEERGWTDIEKLEVKRYTAQDAYASLCKFRNLYEEEQERKRLEEEEERRECEEEGEEYLEFGFRHTKEFRCRMMTRRQLREFQATQHLKQLEDRSEGDPE